MNNSIKKGVVVAVILLFVSVSVIPSTGTFTVKKFSLFNNSGNILYVGGNGTGNYTRIQDAINDSSDGDMVFVFNGTYYENVVVDKSIDLIGENKTITIIDGGGVGDVVYISADEISMTGFTVENGGSVAGVAHDPNGTLVDRFYDSGLEIRSNSNTIFGNIIGHKCAGGIFIKNFSNNGIFHNKIFNNCYKSYSIVLFNSGHNAISNNNVSNSFIGISLYYSSSNYIKENSIYSNDNGLLIDYSSNNNKIYHNNFIENVQNAYDECNNSWDKGYPSCGNYWDDYIGEDNDGDGVGDVPYNISGGNNQDRYPLMEPYGMTELDMDISKILFGFSVIIKNVGETTAYNVQWKITIQGGILLIINKTISGTIPTPILAGEQSILRSGLIFIFGFGPIEITVTAWADNAPIVSKSIPGFLFLFFIKINPGVRI